MDIIMFDLRAGLSHNNDFKPRNAMLDDHGLPVIIIDLDYCTPIGATFRGGTPEWTRWPITLAHPDNVLYASGLVGKFIRGRI